jgi:hypothetical protein
VVSSINSCPHGHPAYEVETEKGWRVKFADGCPMCGNKPCDLPFQLGATPNYVNAQTGGTDGDLTRPR